MRSPRSTGSCDAAAQPLGREEADLVIAALEQGDFRLGHRRPAERRIYRKCATTRALAYFAD